MNKKTIENIIRKALKEELEKYFGPKNGNITTEDRKEIWENIVKKD